MYDRIEDYEWLAESAVRVLKPDRACLVWQAVKWMPQTLMTMGCNLNYKWTFIWYQSNRRGHADFGYPLYTPLFWYEKGKSQVRYPVQDIKAIPFSGNNNHLWQKQHQIIVGYLDAFTFLDSIILDPFTGGGTVPAVCKMLSRNYLAFEIDPETADLARERVRLTQPPLPIEMPEQLELYVVN